MGVSLDLYTCMPLGQSLLVKIIFYSHTSNPPTVQRQTPWSLRLLIKNYGRPARAHLPTISSGMSCATQLLGNIHLGYWWVVFKRANNNTISRRYCFLVANIIIVCFSVVDKAVRWSWNNRFVAWYNDVQKRIKINLQYSKNQHYYNITTRGVTIFITERAVLTSQSAQPIVCTNGCNVFMQVEHTQTGSSYHHF